MMLWTFSGTIPVWSSRTYMKTEVAPRDNFRHSTPPNPVREHTLDHGGIAGLVLYVINQNYHPKTCSQVQGITSKIHLDIKTARLRDIISLALRMYSLDKSPSGRSLDRWEVKALILTHDEQTVAHTVANCSKVQDNIMWMYILGSTLTTWNLVDRNLIGISKNHSGDMSQLDCVKRWNRNSNNRLRSPPQSSIWKNIKGVLTFPLTRWTHVHLITNVDANASPGVSPQHFPDIAFPGKVFEERQLLRQEEEVLQVLTCRGKAIGLGISILHNVHRN